MKLLQHWLTLWHSAWSTGYGGEWWPNGTIVYDRVIWEEIKL